MAGRSIWAIWAAALLPTLVHGQTSNFVFNTKPVVLASDASTPTAVGESPILMPDAAACSPCSAPAKEEPQDLFLSNFFTAGWDEDFTRRSSEDRAPDLALLRVQTNFMEREVRINYYSQSNIQNKTQANTNSTDFLIAYGLDRRFMIEVVGTEEWIEGRDGTPNNSGPSVQLVSRVQLISTADSSYSFNFRVITPDPGLGVHTTTTSYGLAGFEDLTDLGLYRVGLYGSVLFDSLDGPHAAGAASNDVEYDITMAKTFTRPDMPLFGNFTLFAEFFAQTNLDGEHAARTLLTVTPGFRFNLGKIPGLKLGLDNWVMGGVDIPLAGPDPWDATYRLTYIKNF